MMDDGKAAKLELQRDRSRLRMKALKKRGFRKAFGWIAVITYLVFQSHIFVKHDSNDELLSALAPLLSEFKAVSKTNGPRQELGKNRDEKVPLKDYSNPLERDFSRVPAYLEGSSNPPLFGYVMRDLANRFLKPSSPQQQRRNLVEGQFLSSNVLVACPEANALLSNIKEKNPSTIASKKELIKDLGYRVGESFLVESVFHGHNAIAMDSNTGFMDGDGLIPTDILLAILDPAVGKEDSVLSSRLQECIRAGSIEFGTFRISASLLRNSSIDDLATMSIDTQMKGIETFKTFLKAGYKIQILSSSHAPRDELNPYGPNTLFKNVESVESFLRFGAGLAQSAQDIHHLNHKSKNLTLSSELVEPPATFYSILFVTRGLDLAIPTRNAFLNLTAHGADFVLNTGKDGFPYLNCTKSSVRVTESEDDKFNISCFGVDLMMEESGRRRIDDGKKSVFVELWHSHINLSLSEAICFECTKSATDASEQSVSDTLCINRIRSTKVDSANLSNRNGEKSLGPNLLAIELKGVNKAMLDSSLSQLKSLTGLIGLDYFPNFVPHATISNQKDDQDWWKLWDSDVIKEGGYQRYRGSNQCDLSSEHNGDDLALFHGSQMGQMFCFDFDRPNCIGGIHTATHLLSHVDTFIQQNQQRKERWVSYVTLVDGIEETETLPGVLDLQLVEFLAKMRAQMSPEEWSNTIITIFSTDTQEPILFLKANNNTTRLVKENALFVSDLHAIVRSLMSEATFEGVISKGTLPEYVKLQARLVKPDVRNQHKLNEARLESPPSVLSFYADIPKDRKYQLIKPYSGQLEKRAKVSEGCKCATDSVEWTPCDFHPWDMGERTPRNENYMLVDCPGRPLHLEINVLPAAALKKRSSKKRIESSSNHLDVTNIIFLELDSVSQEYADRHFPKTRELLEKYRIKQNVGNKFECVDDICSAEFPYTALAGANSVVNQVAALSGCITLTTEHHCGLNLTASPQLVQICNDPNMAHYGFRLQRVRRKANMTYWCPNRDEEVTKTPWIFGVSNSKGYLNFFGEEFCYDFSPYVTQENVFPKFYFDFQSHKVFCDLVGRKIDRAPELKGKVHRKNWWGVDISDPCIEGFSCHPNYEKASVSLQFIEQVWNAYEKVPKLAFLNAMAAHDYSAEWEMMTLKAELYDEHVYNFLEAMLSRGDSQRTVIILRSDHGLQKGPMSTDYSIQVEHRHPWTEVLVPRRLIVSEEALFNNQARMVTGYDLYKTMRLLMSDRSDRKSVGDGIPGWSFDILSEEISPDRTCEDAKADANLCPNARQSRQYGVCNRLDDSQARFCEIET